MNPDSSRSPAMVMFDLDNTLATSKQAIDSDMAALVASLLARTCVAVISGGKFEQLEKQVAKELPTDAQLDHLYILPTSGAALYTYDGAWKKRYEESLSEDETSRIESAIEQAVEQTGVIDATTPSYGERIEARGAQVTFSALGQEAPWDAKKVWDPDMVKRRAMQAALLPLLPGYDVKMGGATSIDVTKRGVNKAFGVRKLSEVTDIAIADMLYVGDQLENGGNDAVVKETGIATHAVKDPSETKAFISSVLAA